MAPDLCAPTLADLTQTHTHTQRDRETERDWETDISFKTNDFSRTTCFIFCISRIP